MSQKILFLIFISAYLFALAFASSCDANGKCKYGGRCGPDNKCHCSFACNSQSWRTDATTIYCIPPKGNRRIEIFRNICFLTARACETQQDIPLIKLDFKKPRGQRCQGTGEKNTQKWHLCPKPEDFMGPCGGTLNNLGAVSDDGVCLHNVRNEQTRCECPLTKSGEDCQSKLVMVLPSFKMDKENQDGGVNNVLVLVGVGCAVGIVFGLILFALRRIPSKTSRSIIRESPLGEDGENVTLNNSRDDEKSFTMDKAQISHEKSLNRSSGVIGSKMSPENSRSSATKSYALRRQRLEGISIPKSFNNNDANNNHSGESDFKQSNIPTEIQAECSNVTKVTKSNFLAGQFVVSLTKENHTESAPTMKYDQTEAKEPKPCPYMEAYTI